MSDGRDAVPGSEAAGEGGVLMDSETGVTLVELIGTVIVLAILLAVAVPNYTRTRERNVRRAAELILQTIYSGERAYCFTNTDSSRDNRHYYAPASLVNNADWDPIFMDAPRLAGVSFAVSAPAPSPAVTSCDDTGATFTATATRGGSGPCAGQTMQVTKDSPLATGNWKTGSCAQ